MNGTAVGPGRDYYEVLGVDGKTITAFRRLARRCHPDVSAERDAGERFKEIAEAYEITVRILKGIPDGTVLRPPGHGLPHYGAHGRSDLNVNPVVNISRLLSRQQRRLDDQLCAAETARQGETGGGARGP